MKIATFHTHFGALRFYREISRRDASAVMMPVPRKLSASCGTCVRFETEEENVEGAEDLEAIYCINENGYELLFLNSEE